MTTTVDDSDCLRVLKAFQQKENGSYKTTCHCGGGRIFWEDDSSPVAFENVITSRDIFTTSFKLNYVIQPIMDKDLLSGNKLKKLFDDMTPSKALRWCSRLLVQFHKKRHCRQYLTSALKFYLKSFESLKNASFYYNYDVDEMVLEFLRLACKRRLHKSVFMEILKVYYITSDYYLIGHGYEYTPILDDILRITQESKIDILNLWKTGEEEWRKSEHWRETQICFYSSIFENIENFIPLIKYGRTECISIESYSFVKSASRMYLDTIKINNENSVLTFRSLQILQTFAFVYYKRSAPITAAHLLKLMWNCIADPFLSKEDFEKSLEPRSDAAVFLLKQAWIWYDDHVLENLSCPKTPRTLCHLSRCSVRRQLATCLQLPWGVEELFIPKTLKDYILLKNHN